VFARGRSLHAEATDQLVADVREVQQVGVDVERQGAEPITRLRVETIDHGRSHVFAEVRYTHMGTTKTSADAVDVHRPQQERFTCHQKTICSDLREGTDIRPYGRLPVCRMGHKPV